MWLALGSTTWVARRSPSAPIRAMYIQLIGRMLALPWAAAETMPTEGAVPSPSSAARTFPSPAGGRGAVRGRKGEVRLHRARTQAGAAAAVRDAEGLVQVEVRDVRAPLAGPGDAAQGGP